MVREVQGPLLYSLVAVLYALALWSLRRQGRKPGPGSRRPASPRIVLAGRRGTRAS